MARAAVIPPVSPPKRVGRGRPRTRPVTSSQTDTAASKIKKTAATKTATTEPKKRPGRPPKKVEVEAEAETEREEGTDDEIDTIDVKRSKATSLAKTSSTAGGAKRGRKAASSTPVEEPSENDEEDDDEDELAQMDVDVPKKKVGRPRSKPSAKEADGKNEAVSRGRGRPKGSATSSVKESQTGTTRRKVQESTAAPKPIYITTGSAAMKSNLLRGPAKKKTVTFKDLSENEASEEENLPAPTTTRRRRGTGVPEGMGAKPVRKPATGATRGRKPAAGKKGASKPLSPKKATQVAKNYASSDGEEDELSGAKNQVKLIVDSPTKHGSENTRSPSPVRRVNFTPNKASKNVDENGEPTLHPSRLVDFSDSVYMSSPARRPSASPFQFTMKETPRRGGLNFRDGTNSTAQPNLSPIQDSPLKTSPKKANLSTSSIGVPQQPSFSPTNSPLKASPKKGARSPIKGSLGPSSMSISMPQPDFSLSSPLKISPKKGKLGASFSQVESPAKSMTPFTARTSLIQSPAKKAPSPFKGTMTPKKLPAVGEEGDMDGERRGVCSGQAISELPEKTGTPQVNEFGEDDFNEAGEADQPGSPAVPQSETNTAVEAEADPVSEDDAVAMIEEMNTENEENADKNHHMDAEEANNDKVEDHAESHIVDEDQEEVEEHVEEQADEQPEDKVEDQVEELETELDLVDQCKEHPHDNMEDPIANEQENVQPHSDYDTYDCDYLQAEVKDSIEECQRQLDFQSAKEQMDRDTNGSESDEDVQNDHGVHIDHDDGQGSKTQEVQSSRHTPIRMSIPDGFEDVFVDTPLREKINDLNMGGDDNETPHESVPRLSIPDGFEGVFTDTPKQGDLPEDADMDGNRESPLQLQANSVDDSVGQQIDEHDSISEENNVEEDKENTPMVLDEPERCVARSGSVSSSDSTMDLEQFEQITIQEPVLQRIAEQESHSEAHDIQADAEDTCMESDVHESYSPAPRLSLLRELSERNTAMTPRQEDHETQGNTPPDEPPLYPILNGETAMFRDHGRLSMESGGDSTSVIDARRLESATNGGNQTPLRGSIFGKRRSIFEKFTPLADQFSQWKTTSPERSEPKRPHRRGVFSLAGGLKRLSIDISRESDEVSYPDISNHPMADTQTLLAELPGRESMASAIYEDKGKEPGVSQEDMLGPAELERQPMSEIFSDPEQEVDEDDSRDTDIDQIPHSPNRVTSPTPSAHSVHDGQDDSSEKENDPASPAVPAAPVTPMKNKVNLTHTLHTVSKVPLKPEGEVSPLKVCRKRGRSLGNTSPVRSSPRLRKSISSPKRLDEPSHSPRKTPRLEAPKSPRRRSSYARTENKEQQQTEDMDTTASPVKSPRKSLNACSQVLQGAVVHVDVHTTEGEDASGIFIELLQQMGARCVKNWAWNPRSSLSPVDGAEPKEGKVGISHVVFKDGGVRTLEKVRQAGGLVKCVGVGWVLDCERENKWLDEVPYAVDSTIIPRGGAKRRKSMQPRALRNSNGTLVKVPDPTATSTSASGRRSGADQETVDNFMRISPPATGNEPGTPEKRPVGACQTPRTPAYNFNFDNIGMSPATPFFLHNANIVQQTCPPKQTRQGLFSASPSADELSSQRLRLKLEAARRKSLAFKPKARSPLVE